MGALNVVALVVAVSNVGVCESLTTISYASSVVVVELLKVAVFASATPNPAPLKL